MKQVISAIKNQIRLEEARITKRKIMFANKNEVVFSDQLPASNPEYLKELNEALNLIQYRSKPLAKWNKVVDDSVGLPSDLEPLYNKIKAVLDSDCLVMECEDTTALKLVEMAEKFFYDFKPSR